MSLSDPQNFYRLAGKVIPWILGLALVLFVVGFYLGFFVCPVDARQGNSYRIIFIHVSAAWLSMLVCGATTASASCSPRRWPPRAR